MSSVESAECGKCGVWKMQRVENAECKKIVPFSMSHFNFPFPIPHSPFPIPILLTPLSLSVENKVCVIWKLTTNL